MNKKPLSNNNPQGKEEVVTLIKKQSKRPHVISDLDIIKIQEIAKKARELRQRTGRSYEEFALKTGINRNTYFRFERAAEKGDNFTISVLLKVIRGLNLTISEFFRDIE